MTKIYSFIFLFSLISCSQSKDSNFDKSESTATSAQVDSSSIMIPEQKANQPLTVGTDFTIQIHPDSMKFSNSYEGYVALSLEIANDIREHLGQKQLEIEQDQDKYYIYKSIIIDQDRSLKIITNGAKFGYNTMYAALVDDSNIALASIIQVGKMRGDVGDSYLVKATIYNNQEKLIIGVYKRYHTDDFTMGRLDGVYKIHHDSLLLYEVTKIDIKLLEAKSGM